MSLTTKYAKKVWDSDKICVTWHPDRVMAVGDLVMRAGDTTRVDTHVSSVFKGPVPEPVTRPGPKRIDLSSGAKLKVSGHASAPGNSAHVQLGGKGDFFLVGEDAQVTEYPAYQAIRNMVSKIEEAGNWDPAWFLVTAVRRFASFTLTIANGSGAEIALGGAPPHTLHMISAGVSFSLQRGNASTYVLTDCTPMFEAMRVHKSWRQKAPQIDLHLVLRESMSQLGGDYVSTTEVVMASPEDLGLTEDG